MVLSHPNSQSFGSIASPVFHVTVEETGAEKLLTQGHGAVSGRETI